MASPAPKAGLSTTRATMMRIGCKKQTHSGGMRSNDSKEAFRTFAAQSLLGTKDLLLLQGADRSCSMRAAQAEQVCDFQSYTSAVAQALGASSSTGNLTLRPEGPGASALTRAALPAAGLKTEVCDMTKYCNYSSSRYHILADQATPVGPTDKTATWALGHREPAGMSLYP
mmetsp:Transcript_67302/g.175261  ORF Transcript_67302/g.175261 Transcript_67302/m.175261 type:complete len:171 (-) Transcript_67302:117-629(-)